MTHVASTSTILATDGSHRAHGVHDAGSDRYVAKPIGPAVLVRTVADVPHRA